MERHVLRKLSAVALVMVLMAALPAAAQETAGALLAKLAKLSPEARQKALVDGARAEREVTFYSSLQPP